MDKIPQSEEEIKQGSKLLMKVPFFQVPNSIFDNDNKLTEHELIVYIFLCRCGNQGATAFPSLPTIGRKTKTSRRTAARAVSGLIEKGFVSKVNRIGTSNTYEVIDNSGVVPEGHGVVPEGHGGVVPEGHPKKNPPFNKNNEERGTHTQTSSSNETRKAIAKWKEMFNTKLGYKPTLTAKDTQALNKLLDEHGFDQVVILFGEYLKRANEREVAAGYALSWLPGAANRLFGEHAKYMKRCEEEKKEEIDCLTTRIIYEGYDKHRAALERYSKEDQAKIIEIIEHNAKLPGYQDAVAAWRDKPVGDQYLKVVI